MIRLLLLGGGQLEISKIYQANKGLSGARNKALETILGKYVLFIDSDDKLYDEYSIDKLLDSAYKTNGDIIQGSWITFNEKDTQTHIISKEGIVSVNDNVLSGFPWGKLFKYTVLEHFKFPLGYWFEDTPISFILYGLNYKFVGIKDIVYSYRLNPNGISAKASYSDKCIDTFYITRKCLEEFNYFNCKYDKRAYEYLLRQVVTNYKRTRLLSKEVREAIFILTREIFAKYFNNFYTEVDNMKELEKAIRNKQFIKYELINIGK